MGDLSKAVIHCDVDCFYCQVETLDNPVLAGRPLAVHQGNSGGFVAVNYEVCNAPSLAPKGAWIWSAHLPDKRVD